MASRDTDAPAQCRTGVGPKSPVTTAASANRTGLPGYLKSGIESLSGYTMNDVKVHYNSDRPARLNAQAYAQGSQIYLGSGQERHLPHEAWHVVQQKQGRVKPTMQLQRGLSINDDRHLEREADIMGRRVQQAGGGKGTPRPARKARPVAQANVAQLAKKRAVLRRSGRIAEMEQKKARARRSQRGARYKTIVRYQGGVKPATYQRWVPALGGNGLVCPRGSYEEKIRQFQYTGSRAGDNARLGTRKGYVWHHSHDFVSTGPNAGYGTMFLLPISSHRLSHRGGVYQWNRTPGNRRYR
nr:DUF4157 domain-containing protein [Exilibacterium tricleocarpae]